MKRILVALLAAVLALALCACGLTDFLGGLFGGSGSSDAQASSVTQNVQALLDYAKRLEEAGNPEAAAEVYSKLDEAAQADAQYQAAAILEGSSDYNLAQAVADADLQGLNPTESAPAAPVSAEFTDVSESDWYYDAVQWAAKQGVISGETFSPAAPCTRAQALTFLWRAKGKPAPASAQSAFADVTGNDYFFEPVCWATEAGLLSVGGDGMFHPDDPVTRAMTVTFLYRAEGSNKTSFLSPYSDVSDADWYADAATWAWWEEIVTLNDARTFDPSGVCTRAHYVNFLYRCYG